METIFTKEAAVEDLRAANIQIIKRPRYVCGLVSEEQKNAIGCGDFFFESPDGQCGELYTELRKLGWSSKKYEAEYYWEVRKGDLIISYTEGDISIF